MKTSISFRKTVMLRAYHIMAETGKNWADCLRKAWQLYRINKEMHKGSVSFYFEKKDGEIRKANGTLKIEYEFKTQNQPNPKVFTYFDVDAGAFRCFKIENFIMIAKPEPAKIKSAATISKTPAKLVRIRRRQRKSA